MSTQPLQACILISHGWSARVAIWWQCGWNCSWALWRSGSGPWTVNSFEFMAKGSRGLVDIWAKRHFHRRPSQLWRGWQNFSPLYQQIISTDRIVANWQTIEGPVSCLSVLSLSFCVLSFQSASTDCNLASQVSGFVERVTMGCQAGGRSFILAELPGLIGAGERNMAGRWSSRTMVLIGEGIIVWLVNEMSYLCGKRRCEMWDFGLPLWDVEG